MATPRRAPYPITGFLAIGPCRGAGGPSVDSLAKLGFRHIIDLNVDPSERSLSRKAGVSYHPVRTIDEYSFDSWMGIVREAVRIIARAERRREKVYLHCTYGYGRSPTIAMAYLVTKDWAAKSAIEHVKKRARHVWCKGNPVLKYERIVKAFAGPASVRRKDAVDPSSR